MNITTAVFRPWLLYTVQSNFAFILFEFFSVPKFSTPEPTMKRAFNFFRFVFTPLLLFSFFIWLWHVWTGFYFELLYSEFRTNQQCGFEPCKCHEQEKSIFQVCFRSAPSFHLSHLIMVCLDRFVFWSSWFGISAKPTTVNNVDLNPAFVRSRGWLVCFRESWLSASTMVNR